MRRLPAIILAAFLAALIFSGCGEEVHRYVHNAGSTTPTMSTHDVETFISDSGYTRYHLSTPVWYVYDDTSEPYWRFPEGLSLEQYDDAMAITSTVDCDSAIYYSRRRLWQLDGNVVMVSTEGDSFLTEQLFWEQESRRIRSDSFIHIVRSDRILEGYGFESDQSMRDYLIHHPTAILPAQRPGDRKPQGAPSDSDSLAPAAGRPRGAAVRPSQRQVVHEEHAPEAPLYTNPDPGERPKGRIDKPIPMPKAQLRKAQPAR